MTIKNYVFSNTTKKHFSQSEREESSSGLTLI